MKKTLGPSPGTDRKELLLAKLLQNAHARGLGWCRGTSYADKSGSPIRMEDAANCCAIGAAYLESDSWMDCSGYTDAVQGNDSLDSNFSFYVDASDDEDLGHAFKVAMTVDE